MPRCVCLTNLHPKCLGEIDRDMDSLYDALKDARDLIDSLTPTFIIAAVHGEGGTPELRELNKQRLARIDAAISSYRSIE